MVVRAVHSKAVRRVKLLSIVQMLGPRSLTKNPASTPTILFSRRSATMIAVIAMTKRKYPSFATREFVRNGSRQSCTQLMGDAASLQKHVRTGVKL